MNIKIISKDKEKFSFILSGVKPSFANAIRRSMIDEVPTMAIENIEIRKNNSALYDEVLAHRLGLVVLNTDLKSYNLPEKCKCNGEGCARCQVEIVLKVKGPRIVYTSDLKPKDPKITPAQPESVIAKILKGQDIELIATAVLGKGRDHAKWAPCLAIYKNEPVINIGNVSNVEEVAAKCPLNLFEIKSGKLKLIKDYELACHLCEACQDESNGKIKVSYKEDTFIFTVEPWGQLDVKDILKRAVDELDEKSEEFVKLVKALK